MPFLRQVMVSVTATVVATALLTGLKFGFASRSTPDLTASGKFAARIETPVDLPEPPRLVLPEPRLSVLLAGADQHMAAPQVPEIAPPLPAPSVGPVKVQRRAARLEARRHPSYDEGRDVQPPRRADFVLDATAQGSKQGETEAGLWTTTKSLAQDAISLGGMALDRLNPMRLLQ